MRCCFIIMLINKVTIFLPKTKVMAKNCILLVEKKSVKNAVLKIKL